MHAPTNNNHELVDLDTSFMLWAACKGQPTEMFFPVKEDDRAYVAAWEVCIGCPVRERCLEWALTNRIPEGMYGAVKPSDRRKLWRKKGK